MGLWSTSDLSLHSIALSLSLPSWWSLLSLVYADNQAGQSLISHVTGRVIVQFVLAVKNILSLIVFYVLLFCQSAHIIRFCFLQILDSIQVSMKNVHILYCEMHPQSVLLSLTFNLLLLFWASNFIVVVVSLSSIPGRFLC